MLLKGFARSTFRNLRRFLKTVVGLEERDIQLSLKQFMSNYTTYERTLGNYSVKDSLELIYTIMKGPCKLNTMILARKQNLVCNISVERLKS